jgi:3',5'-cyclic AMP phosphodiesterase CpdA
VVTIAHISDPHVGSPFFVPNLMNRVIKELNEEIRPDVVICSGDLTNEGYRQEYKNWMAYRERIERPVLTVPGNHDARNVGYLHFEELIGPRHWFTDVQGVRIVGADSSEPDLNEGQIGRERYEWLRQMFAVPADLKVFVLHHHLLPVPGTGRERSTVMDAGDLLEVLIGAGVNIVLSGHKHVPYVWRLENLYVANAGTVASLRLRGYTKPCYNVLEFEGDEVKIHRKYPFGASSVIAHFSLSSGAQYHRELEPPVQQGAGPSRLELD